MSFFLVWTERLATSIQMIEIYFCTMWLEVFWTRLMFQSNYGSLFLAFCFQQWPLTDMSASQFLFKNQKRIKSHTISITFRAWRRFLFCVDMKRLLKLFVIMLHNCNNIACQLFLDTLCWIMLVVIWLVLNVNVGQS